MTRAETVIVGGGPAGSATASGLAALGRDVVLIERTAKPHNKVCGEFLSVETQTQLQRLGVDPPQHTHARAKKKDWHRRRCPGDPLHSPDVRRGAASALDFGVNRYPPFTRRTINARND